MTEEMMNTVMTKCIKNAQKNIDNNQYPIAAMITDNEGKIIVSSRSSLRRGYDPTNHPEMEVIRKASAKLKQKKLFGCYLFTTLEPCPMCTSAAIWACLEGIVYGSSQEEAIAFADNTPNRQLSWKQIPIHADYILSKAQSDTKLYGGIQRKMCCELYK